MKKSLICLLSVPMLLLNACGTPKPESDLTPRVSQMKAICELSVMECYYHNVAKFYEEDAESFLFWSKDKEFWIEYGGIVKLGIDTANVAIEVNGDTVSIALPEATVLGCKVDQTTLKEDCYIVADGSAKVTADDQTEAFAAAQKNMEEAAAQDTTLLTMARQRVQQLLEEYIHNLSEASGQSYTIQWQDTAGQALPEPPSSPIPTNSDAP